jgi:hypothetical protein
MNRNALKNYPHLVLAQAISGKESRKNERRAAALAPNTTTMAEERAKFDETIQDEFSHGIPYPELAAGAFIGEPGGYWVYQYYHIQARWIGWQAGLTARGIKVLP